MYKDQNSGLQVLEKGEADTKYLLLQYKNGMYSGNRVDVSGLEKNAYHLNSGPVTLVSLDNNSFTKLMVVNNKVTQVYHHHS